MGMSEELKEMMQADIETTVEDWSATLTYKGTAVALVEPTMTMETLALSMPLVDLATSVARSPARSTLLEAA